MSQKAEDVFNKFFKKPTEQSEVNQPSDSGYIFASLNLKKPAEQSEANQPPPPSTPQTMSTPSIQPQKTFFTFSQPQQPQQQQQQQPTQQPSQPSAPTPTPEPSQQQTQQTPFSPTQPQPVVQQPSPAVQQPVTPQPTITSQPTTQTFNFNKTVEPTPSAAPEPPKTSFLFTSVGKKTKDEEEKFDLRPISSEEQQGIVKMIYGRKGAGKTVLALSELSDGMRYCCLSFDNQTKVIRDQIYKVGDEQCLVFDAMRYYTEETPELKLETSERTLRYIFSLLNGPIKDFQPDIILIDGTEIMNQICEGAMRYNNNISPFGGVEWTYWKERNMYMNQIHRLSCQIAKVGVTYTAYVSVEEYHTAMGTKKREEPKWAGDIEYKARVTIKVEGDDGKDVRAFYATVENSKLPVIPTQPKKLVGQCFSNGTYRIGGIRVLRAQTLQPSQ